MSATDRLAAACAGSPGTTFLLVGTFVFVCFGAVLSLDVVPADADVQFRLAIAVFAAAIALSWGVYRWATARHTGRGEEAKGA